MLLAISVRGSVYIDLFPGGVGPVCDAATGYGRERSGSSAAKHFSYQARIIMANENLKPRDTPIKSGDSAPDFVLPDQNRADWKLSDAVKKGDVVLCFYPLDFSPTCQIEMKCVTDDFARYAAKGAQVVGISCDSFYAHKAWAEQLGLKQPLLADLHRAVCKAYGIYFAPLNVAGRATIIIGKDPSGNGRVKWVQARELKDAMKAEDVLAAIS
jgi:peroxiredoxin